MISVLMADQLVALRHGLKLLFAQTPDIRLTDDTGSVDEACKLLRKNAYDAVLIDICLLGKEAFPEALAQFRERFPELPLIVFSWEDSLEEVRQALTAGISGYVGKASTPAQLIEAIRKAVAGERVLDPSIAQALALDSLTQPQKPPHEKLSEREREILSLLAQGRGISEIGDLLFRSPKTVSTHKARLMRKMGIATDVELIRYALEHRIA